MYVSVYLSVSVIAVYAYFDPEPLPSSAPQQADHPHPVDAVLGELGSTAIGVGIRTVHYVRGSMGSIGQTMRRRLPNSPVASPGGSVAGSAEAGGAQAQAAAHGVTASPPASPSGGGSWPGHQCGKSKATVQRGSFR